MFLLTQHVFSSTPALVLHLTHQVFGLSRATSLVLNMLTVLLGKTGHFHDKCPVKTAFKHIAGDFQPGIALSDLLAFLQAFLQAFLLTFLLKLLCNGHKFILMLWQTLGQFANKTFCIWRGKTEMYTRYSETSTFPIGSEAAGMPQMDKNNFLF
ncbi:hypothetical protein CTZ24_25075 (plasmid) [Pantoea phytobeneficialis]|uniref:Uncharacterized protein n=1 Tax=Pantoea phytobeneficialis TaxID=2052056 RepID=A0AAP9HBC1_9GAMM|nr:hypothetical protein CTZ24_25075 [Pantoea phytobeneficialis]